MCQPGRSPPTRGPDVDAPCTPTSGRCRSTSWPPRTPSTATRSSPTFLDVATGARAVAVEHWYRHRTSIENVFRDAKLGAALRHLPSGYPQVNTAWMWGALLAASIAGWLHQLTATRSGARLFGHGIRGGQAMIATLRHRLIRVPARLVRHGGALTLRLPPGHHLLDEVLARIRALPATS